MSISSYTGLDNNGNQPFQFEKYLNQKQDIWENRSIISINPVQPISGVDSTLYRSPIETSEDPEWLSIREIREIFSSLNDLANGNFKEGQIDDLLQDLNSV